MLQKKHLKLFIIFLKYLKFSLKIFIRSKNYRFFIIHFAIAQSNVQSQGIHNSKQIRLS